MKNKKPVKDTSVYLDSESGISMVNGCEQSCDHNSEIADRTKPVNCENLSDVNNLKSSLTVEVEHVVNEEKTCCDLKVRCVKYIRVFVL